MRTPLSEIDYTKLLTRYDSRLVSSARNIVSEVFDYYRKRAEERKNDAPGLAKYATKIAKNSDEFVYEIVKSGIRKPMQMRRYLKEEFDSRVLNIPSQRDSIAFTADLYSEKGQVTYEIGHGGTALMASVIYDKVKDKEKIFLVDPKKLTPYNTNLRRFSDYGTRVRSFAESFRIEDGKLVTDVIRDRGSMFKKIELPFADRVYLHNLLPFINKDSNWSVSEIYSRGYSTRRDFAKGVRNILKEDGLLVTIDDVRAIENFRRDFPDMFRVEDRFLLSKSVFSKKEFYGFGVGTFRPR